MLSVDHQIITKLTIEALRENLDQKIFDKEFTAKLLRYVAGCGGNDCDFPAYIIKEYCKCGGHFCDYKKCCEQLLELEKKRDDPYVDEDERRQIENEISKLKKLGVTSRRITVHCCGYMRKVVTNEANKFQGSCESDMDCVCKEHDGVNYPLYRFYYNVAVRLYITGRKSEAAVALGRALHYVQDGVLARWRYVWSDDCATPLQGVDLHDKIESRIHEILHTDKSRALGIINEAIRRALNTRELKLSPSYNPEDVLLRAIQNTAVVLLRFQRDITSIPNRRKRVLYALVGLAILGAVGMFGLTFPLLRAIDTSVYTAMLLIAFAGFGAIYEYLETHAFLLGFASRIDVPETVIYMGALKRVEKCIPGLFQEFCACPQNSAIRQ